jgi:5-methylcytosine-specific restriction enzyme subunit McrC
MLAYALGFVSLSKDRKVLNEHDGSFVELLILGLLHGLKSQSKKGLLKSYIPVRQDLSVMKGRVYFPGTMNMMLRGKLGLVCDFEDYTINNIENQLIKSTLLRSLRLSGVSEKTRSQGRHVLLRLSDVSEIPLSRDLWSLIHLDRNSRAYRTLLSIALLLFECGLVTESVTSCKELDARFYDYIESKMESLFEEFVRNFFHARSAEIGMTCRGRQDIRWDLVSKTISGASYVPKMQTDVVLEGEDRKIILDAKFYSDGPLNKRGKYHEKNLYQIYAYVTQLARRAEKGGNFKPHKCDLSADGIVLYAAVDEVDFFEPYDMGPHQLIVATIDLSLEWQMVEKRLLSLVARGVRVLNIGVAFAVMI